MSGLSEIDRESLDAVAIYDDPHYPGCLFDAVEDIVTRAVNEVLSEAANELERINAIGNTPIREVTPEQAHAFETHPLGEDIALRTADEIRTSVADWLRARTT